MVTIKDVARYAGVSTATVSNTLSGAAPVSIETARKVTEAIEKLNYRPNILARSLKSKRSKTIGIIIPNISNPFFGEITRGIEEVASSRGYSVILCDSNGQLEREVQHLRVLQDRQVDGLLVIPTGQGIEWYRDAGLPTVFIDRELKLDNAYSIVIDNELGAYMATSYLIRLGHRRIAFVAGFRYLLNIQERLAGYTRALKERDLPLDDSMIVECDQTFQGGKIVLDLLRNPNPPSAVFITNDAVAVGAIRILHENGIRVPNDVSIVGFDDIELASLTIPALTTVSQPKYEMGKKATNMLLKLLDNRIVRKRKVVLKPKLVVRESCKVNDQE